MVDPREHFHHVATIGARLNRDGPLPYRRQQFLRERGGVKSSALPRQLPALQVHVVAEPTQSRLGENDCRHVGSLAEFAQARRHIPAPFFDHDVRAKPSELPRAPHTARAHTRAARKRVEPARRPAHEHVRGRGAFEQRGNFQSRRIVTGKILETVNGDINRPREQRVFEFLCEESFASRLACAEKIQVELLISARDENLPFRRQLRASCRERGLCQIHLRERERRAARADDHMRHFAPSA